MFFLSIVRIYHPTHYVIKLKQIMDATRISDNVVIVMKRVNADSEKLKDDQNHNVPILDYFADEQERGIAYLVMPLLREFNDPPFTTVCEVMGFVRQMLEVRVFVSFC
jgi:hypothetical protein